MAITAQQQQKPRVPIEHRAEWEAQQQRKSTAQQQPSPQPIQTPGFGVPPSLTWSPPGSEKKPADVPMKH